jgi:hypothetical protein
VLAVVIVNNDNDISCFQSIFEQICCSKAEISCSDHDVVVGLVVSLDVSKQSPVIKVRDCFTKHMVGCRWPDKHTTDPQGERGKGFIRTIVWLGIDVGDPEEVIWAAAISKSCHLSVIQLFDGIWWAKRGYL